MIHTVHHPFAASPGDYLRWHNVTMRVVRQFPDGTTEVDDHVPQWCSAVPRTCEACGEPWTDGVFYDARTPDGRWGLICKPCHVRFGAPLGTGRGQEYDLESRVKLRG